MRIDKLLELHIRPVPKSGITVGVYRLEQAPESIPNDGPRLFYHGQKNDLLPLEYHVLLPFFMNPGMMLSSQKILDYLKGERLTASESGGLVKAVVHNIRKKLPKGAKGMIRSAGSRGYMLPIPEDSQYLPCFVTVYGNLEVNILEQSVAVNGNEINLKPPEYAILSELVLARGAVVDQDRLMENSRGQTFLDRYAVLKQLIYGIRKKLGDNAYLIQTIRLDGYRLMPEDEIQQRGILIGGNL